jgi:hypothetical protein
VYSFHTFFSCHGQKEAMIIEVVTRGGLLLSFCRSISPRAVAEWRDMGILLNGVCLSVMDDLGYWLL